jgi:hypothetical protein
MVLDVKNLSYSIQLLRKQSQEDNKFKARSDKVIKILSQKPKKEQKPKFLVV